jgi:hypothetical protein
MVVLMKLLGTQHSSLLVSYSELVFSELLILEPLNLNLLIWKTLISLHRQLKVVAHKNPTWIFERIKARLQLFEDQ